MTEHLSNFDTFVEHINNEYDAATIQEAMDLFEQICDIVEENGHTGIIAGNMYFALMCDGVESVADETGAENVVA